MCEYAVSVVALGTLPHRIPYNLRVKGPRGLQSEGFNNGNVQ